MVKRRMRQRAEKLSAAESRSGPTKGKIDKPGVTLSRGRQKRAAARAREERKRDFIERELEKLGKLKVTKKSRNSKPKKAPGLALQSLGDALPDLHLDTLTKEDECKRPKQLSAKARKKLVAEETAQVDSVLAHPAFQADPVEALRQHLLNTVCAAPAAVPPALSGNAPGAKKRKPQRDELKESASKKMAKLKATPETVQAVREEAKAAVKKKKELKMQMADAAARLRKKRDRGVSKASPGGQRRGRIGVKRPKMLDIEND